MSSVRGSETKERLPENVQYKEEKHMKLRKAMALLLASTMALSMAACGGSSSSSSDNSSSDAKTTDTADSSDSSSSDVTLSVTIWDSNQEPGLTQIMNDFTEKTGIKTKYLLLNGTSTGHCWNPAHRRIFTGCILDAFQ